MGESEKFSSEHIVHHAHTRVRLNLYVPKHVFDSVEDISHEEDWTKTQVVVEALKKYIKNYKRRIRSEAQDGV